MTQQTMGMVLAGVSALLFLAAAAIGLWRLFLHPVGQLPGCGRPLPVPGGRGQRLAVAGALAWCLFLLTALCIAAHRYAPDQTPLQAVASTLCGGLDARHYLDLARWGYGAGESGFAEQYLMIVFFPLWPWLLRPFALLGLNLWLVGTVLSIGLTAVGTLFLYRCVYRLSGSGRTAAFACAVQLLLPGSFFFVLPQTEALFYCLNFAFLDAMQRDKPGQAGLFGLLASLCRANGVLLTGYAVLWAILALRRNRRLRVSWLLPMAGPVAGLAVYLGINWAVYGNAFQFTIYQQQHWNHSFCLFPQAVAIMCRYIGSDSVGIYIGLWTVVLIFAELLLLVLASRRLPPDWLLLGLAGVAMMNGQTWLISAQRYALGMPALAPAAGILARRWQKAVLLAVLAVLWGIYFAAFVNHAPIY